MLATATPVSAVRRKQSRASGDGERGTGLESEHVQSLECGEAPDRHGRGSDHADVVTDGDDRCCRRHDALGLGLALRPPWEHCGHDDARRDNGCGVNADQDLTDAGLTDVALPDSDRTGTVGGVDQGCAAPSCSPSRAPVKKSMSPNGARSPRQSSRIWCASAYSDSLRGNSASS